MSGSMPRQNFPYISRSDITSFSENKSCIWNRRYLNKPQKILALPFLRILWMLIRTFGQWLRQCVPIRQLQTMNNTRIGKCELQSPNSQQSPKWTVVSYEKKKAPCHQKGIAVPCRVVLGKNLIKSKTKFSWGRKITSATFCSLLDILLHTFCYIYGVEIHLFFFKIQLVM